MFPFHVARIENCGKVIYLHVRISDCRIGGKSQQTGMSIVRAGYEVVCLGTRVSYGSFNTCGREADAYSVLAGVAGIDVLILHGGCQVAGNRPPQPARSAHDAFMPLRDQFPEKLESFGL